MVPRSESASVQLAEAGTLFADGWWINPTGVEPGQTPGKVLGRTARAARPMKAVTIEVPATTSNLGPGYDCLGVALSIYNRVTVAKEAGEAPFDMAAEAAAAFFSKARRPAFSFTCRIEGEVPISRGLGSSVTLRLGVLTGLNVLAGKPLSRTELFEVGASLEGHPDNAAPAQFGGFTVAGGEDRDAPPLRFAVSPALKFVLLVPNFEVRTADSRRILPEDVNRKSAVASSARACRITAAFAGGRYEALRDAFEDSAFHQPHRLPLVPFLPKVVAAGRAAGALGGFLSGSGSTVACLTLAEPEAVAGAMLAASGLEGARTLVTQADNRGARLWREPGGAGVSTQVAGRNLEASGRV